MLSAELKENYHKHDSFILQRGKVKSYRALYSTHFDGSVGKCFWQMVISLLSPCGERRHHPVRNNIFISTLKHSKKQSLGYHSLVKHETRKNSLKNNVLELTQVGFYCRD